MGTPGQDSRSPDELQDLLLDSEGFSDFMLELVLIAAAGLGSGKPVLCSITVEREGFPLTVASSELDAMFLDERQYAFDNGPCLTALRQQRTVFIPELAESRNWEDYAREIASSGVRTILAVPVEAGSGTQAALNCYSREPGIMDATFISAVQAFAGSISRILRLALRFHLPALAGADLSSELRARGLVDAAVAVIMIEDKCSRAEAFAQLGRSAFSGNVRVGDRAIEVLREARRAQGME
ncbi:GAF and ANTAR domain-containing protein [Paeniglutamicibacter gangotriensis]|uniref:ANTAR domain protein n=2 Tax=Paeniglutamicibacter gangotriensis TaxID=254787 RepID=M7MNP9_9MICC|nr:GAF and ANTAR domain-containing protein [Paeniglutamicibacter gangotriensis]EMQ96661.1 ANTAR domain protein [Paeniglutamicibacter gangotriensis Lz1y]KAA0975258.1 GAF and ANTAR domain-containing protein [Paeniglutamicibacter gangotriensis]